MELEGDFKGCRVDNGATLADLEWPFIIALLCIMDRYVSTLLFGVYMKVKTGSEVILAMISKKIKPTSCGLSLVSNDINESFDLSGNNCPGCGRISYTLVVKLSLVSIQSPETLSSFLH